MKQINLQITKSFLKDLLTLMKLKGISTKSEAIRIAVHETVKKMTEQKKTHFKSWLGMGMRVPLRAKMRFKNEDSLWEKE